jgi:CBS domain-containing protein
MHVEQLMSSPVMTCHPQDTLNHAAQLMWEHGCGAIPVVDDAGALVGIITDRDICMAAYTQGGPLESIQVASAMARNVFTARSTDDIGRAETIMAEHQIRRLPVVDGQNQPIGILSLSDVARAAAQPAPGMKNGVAAVARTLAAIGQPRPHEPPAA